jgi:cholesterol oxidase
MTCTLDFDAIVIGSGFGGAVSACRLAQAGRQVLVLERGRRWTPQTYPRDLSDPWFWSQSQPHKHSGWIDLRCFSDMSVVAGSGVGGGSLIYANVSVEAKPDIFNSGWPSEINYATLKPYYDQVADMLGVQTVPDNQLSKRTVLMRDAAKACGWEDRFRKLPLAVSFNPDYDPHAADPRGDQHSKKFTNQHGKVQGTCVHCGNCDIGCQVQAKNTLDLNYLAVAEKHGAEIRPLHVVVKLEPLGATPDGSRGWRVHCDVIDTDQESKQRTSFTACSVILGAGSIGTTELLLRCRDEHRTLPSLSKQLGCEWAFNGDFVTPTFYKNRRISPSHGVTISCAIDLLDGVHKGQPLFIEDGGLPNLARNLLHRQLQKARSGVFKKLLKNVGHLIDDGDPLDNMMPWFGQGIDAANGRLSWQRKWYAPWSRSLRMHWPYQQSAANVQAMVEVHTKLAEATQGDPVIPPAWTYLHNLITPHPLGGCNMSDGPATGVVNHLGQVFGYQNLFVMDGAAIPTPLGLNPSRTIAAVAERNVQCML